MSQTKTTDEADDKAASASASTVAPPLPKDLELPEFDAAGRQIWRVGNLTYTKMGLALLFFWLLWFDFSFTLMESVLGPIIQYRLKNELHMPSLFYSVLLTTVPSIFAFSLVPIISVRSDRHRGPRGRRIPFLMYGAPVVCVMLALVGFGNEIGAWVQAAVLPSASLDSVLIWTFSILFFLFGVFNLFLGTTFYYLFNDVVPQQHFIKFSAYMRAVSTLAGMLYMWYIAQYSTRPYNWGPLDVDFWFIHYHSPEFWYPKLILVGAAVFYTIAGTLAIMMVKEPQYPPPPPLGEGETFIARTVTTCQTLVKECFCHRFYVLLFITMVVQWTGYLMGQWQNPARMEMMDWKTLNHMMAPLGFISLGLTLLTASFGDRFKPLPLMVFALTLNVMAAPIQLLFLVPGLSSDTYVTIAMVFSVVGLPLGVILGLADGPLLMSIMPRERYGQFSAAQAMLRTIVAGIFGSILAGAIMQLLESHMGSYAWRFAWVWGFVFQIATIICFWLLYCEWKKLGGRHGFKPPPVIARKSKDARDAAI